ncbi:MAG: TetR/AcrR family transcriptional regulator [Planctomycetota bacterium]
MNPPIRTATLPPLPELTRKERERLDHRQAILDAALQLFAERGYDKVAMRDIAARAGFATGTLYNFFPGKDALLGELVRWNINEAHDRLAAVLDAPGDEVDRLKAFLRLKGEICHARQAFVHLYVHVLRDEGLGPVRELVMERMNSIIAHLERLFRAGVARGRFMNLDPYMMAITVNGISSVYIFQMIHQPGRIDYFAQVDQIVDLLFSRITSAKDKP